ncbi:MAG: cation-transporting P-type ATPase, partial [Alphaproteobacteria bacterium]|nr:cation-transporting P-type ATPase [Alphaproteobacteria bacterium]
MIKNNILAKNPNKIPESGNIQLLCTDKTGTLTRGFLEPVHNFSADGTDIGFDGTNGGAVKDMFYANIALTTGATYDANHEIIGGNLTARALLGATRANAAQITKIQNENPATDRIVFNSANKFAAANTDSGPAFYLGAPEVILSHAKYCIDKDGNINPISRDTINKLIKQNAARAMRLVATAYSKSWASDEKLPDDLVFISLVAMRDQVRDGVPNVVATMRKSGVQVMMITGDIIDTARAIAIDCGIMAAPDDMAIT